MGALEALVSLCVCAGKPESLLLHVDNVIGTTPDN